MSKGWNYSSGSWNITCDVCGKKMKASKARHRWDGFIVCDADFEHRHPQDFIRTKPDNQTVPFSRPLVQPYFSGIDINGEPTVPTYIDTGSSVCTFQGKSGQAGLGTSGCAQVGKLINGYL